MIGRSRETSIQACWLSIALNLPTRYALCLGVCYAHTADQLHASSFHTMRPRSGCNYQVAITKLRLPQAFLVASRTQLLKPDTLHLISIELFVHTQNTGWVLAIYLVQLWPQTILHRRHIISSLLHAIMADSGPKLTVTEINCRTNQSRRASTTGKWHFLTLPRGIIGLM